MHLCSLEFRCQWCDLPVGHLHLMAVVNSQDDLLEEEARMLLLQPMAAATDKADGTCLPTLMTPKGCGAEHYDGMTVHLAMDVSRLVSEQSVPNDTHPDALVMPGNIHLKPHRLIW